MKPLSDYQSAIQGLYAAWQHSENQQTRIREQQAFWLKAFADEVSPLQLPTDYPRPINRDFAGDFLRFELSQQEYEQLKALCEKEGVTMFMMLISIFSILLSKLGNTEDLVIGTLRQQAARIRIWTI